MASLSEKVRERMKKIMKKNPDKTRIVALREASRQIQKEQEKKLKFSKGM